MSTVLQQKEKCQAEEMADPLTESWCDLQKIVHTQIFSLEIEHTL